MESQDISQFINLEPLVLNKVIEEMAEIEKECIAGGNITSKFLPLDMIYGSLSTFAFMAGMQAILRIYNPEAIVQDIMSIVNEANSSGEMPELGEQTPNVIPFGKKNET